LNKKQKRRVTAFFLIREKLAFDLCEEIHMRKEEAYEIVDFAFQITDGIPLSYEKIKSEIKAYIVINMLSLVTKFQ
tara:strand:+ start:271 stop:498 length:228 start_codon:yes stop_codon:yes gene_type:complete